jgi:hypothetical protein
VTILVTRDGSGGNSPTPPGDGQASEFASANDTGPVNIITEDPTCDAWGRVVRTYADKSKSVNWGDRDPAIPATAWTVEQRSMYETVRDAMTEAGVQAAKLAKSTPHRVMRELYEQFIAYSTAFNNTLPDYKERDRHLASTTDSIATATAHICSAIEYRSVQPVAPLVSDPEPPAKVASISDTADTAPFLSSGDEKCSSWISMLSQFDGEIADWLAIDPEIAAHEWTPEQRAVNERVAPLMSNNADELERIGRESKNPIFEDFATLAAQYRRAYVLALPEYTSIDGFLAETSTNLVRTINSACKAAA